MMTVNALAAADSVLVPLQSQFLSLKGLEQLIVSIMKVKQKLNPKLSFEGILLTMVDARTKFSKEIMELVRITAAAYLFLKNISRCPCGLRKRLQRGRAFLYMIRKGKLQSHTAF